MCSSFNTSWSLKGCVTWHLAPVLCGGFVARPFRVDCLVSLSLYSCCETQKSATAFLCNTNRAQPDLRHRRDRSFFHPEVTFLLLLPFVFSDPNRPVFTAVVRDEIWGWTGWHGNRLLSYQWADELKTNRGCGNTLTGASEECLMVLEQFDVFVEFRLIQTCLGPNHVSNKAMW